MNICTPPVPPVVVPVVRKPRQKRVRKFIMPRRGRWVCPNCDMDFESVGAIIRKHGYDGAESIFTYHDRGDCIKPDPEPEPKPYRTPEQIMDDFQAEIYPGDCPKGGLARNCRECQRYLDTGKGRLLFRHGEKKLKRWGRVVTRSRFVLVSV